MLATLTRRSAVALALAAALPGRAAAQDVRVTILTIMASDRPDANPDPRLKDVAREVRKHEPNLTSFRVGKQACKQINVGQKEAIELVENKASADVKLLAKDDSKNRVTIEVKPPLVGAITYSTCYDKFFPIVTRAVVDGERLIIAVMVKPAAEKGAKAAGQPTP